MNTDDPGFWHDENYDPLAGTDDVTVEPQLGYTDLDEEVFWEVYAHFRTERDVAEAAESMTREQAVAVIARHEAFQAHQQVCELRTGDCPTCRAEIDAENPNNDHLFVEIPAARRRLLQDAVEDALASAERAVADVATDDDVARGQRLARWAAEEQADSEHDTDGWGQW